MKKKPVIIEMNNDSDLEKIEEDIFKAAEKSGKKNVIVNIITYPVRKVKHRWNIHYKFNKKHLVLDIFIFLAFCFLVGLNIFWVMGGFNYLSDKIDLQVSLNGEAKAGGLATFVIDYGNKNKFKLIETVLSVELPRNFILENVSRQDFDQVHHILKINELESGAHGQLLLTGRLWQDYGTEGTVRVGLNYFKTDSRGEKLWGQFTKTGVFNYVVKSSLVAWSDDLAGELFAGEVVSWNFAVKNNAEDWPLDNLRLVKVFPENLFASELSEQFALHSGEIKNFHSEFVLPNELSKLTFGYDLYLEDLEHKILLNKVKKEVVLKSSPLVLEIISDKILIMPGDKVSFKTDIENTADDDLANSEISLNFVGGFWNLENREPQIGRVDGQTLLLTSNDWPELAYLESGKKTEKELVVPTWINDINGRNILSVESLVKIKINNREVVLKSAQAQIKLKSNLGLLAYPVYFAKTGDQLGRGPLPARVGEETKYWFLVRLVNDLNEAGEVQVKMQLDPRVKFTGNSSVPVGEPIIFDNETNSITWKMKSVPIKENNLGFAIELSITPDKNDLGKYPNLIVGSEISGLDLSTNEMISKSYGAVTTELMNDEKGQLKDAPVGR
ncbi:MAG: hypothetical protein WCT18_00680 [Patescibacteria group bacterium]